MHLRLQPLFLMMGLFLFIGAGIACDTAKDTVTDTVTDAVEKLDPRDNSKVESTTAVRPTLPSTPFEISPAQLENPPPNGMSEEEWIRETLPKVALTSLEFQALKRHVEEQGYIAYPQRAQPGAFFRVPIEDPLPFHLISAVPIRSQTRAGVLGILVGSDFTVIGGVSLTADKNGKNRKLFKVTCKAEACEPILIEDEKPIIGLVEFAESDPRVAHPQFEYAQMVSRFLRACDAADTEDSEKRDCSKSIGLILICVFDICRSD